MGTRIPPSVDKLLAATETGEAARAWALFLEEFSGLILHVARRMGAGHDDAMDGYLHVIEALEANEFRRLRSYSESGAASFTTWLVAVCRRLCVDEHRRKFGRVRSTDGDESHVSRWNLASLASAVESLDGLESEAPGPADIVDSAERTSALEAALDELDTSDRLLIRLRFTDGLPVPRIARILGEPTPFTVYRRLDRILAQLKRDLRVHGVEGVTG